MNLKISCEVSPCTSTFARKETYRKHVLQHHQSLGEQQIENLLKKIREMKDDEFVCMKIE